MYMCMYMYFCKYLEKSQNTSRHCLSKVLIQITPKFSYKSPKVLIQNHPKILIQIN